MVNISIPEECIKALKASVSNRLDAIFEAVMDDFKRSPAGTIEWGKEEFLPLYDLWKTLKEQLNTTDMGTLYEESDFQRAVDLCENGVDEDFLNFLKETYIPYSGSYEDLISDIALARRDWLQDYEGEEYTEALNKLKLTTEFFLRTNNSKLPVRR